MKSCQSREILWYECMKTFTRVQENAPPDSWKSPLMRALLDCPPRRPAVVRWSIPPLVHGIITLLTLVLILPVMTLLRCIALGLRLRGRQRVLLYAARLACLCIGLRLHIIGEGHHERGPRMFVANHVSWLDIILLCATAPAFYIASADVRSWPLFGFMARIGETEFISQSRGVRAMLRERRRLEKRLDDGESLVIFPEGGRSGRLRPGLFYSAMLIERTAAGVPVSLAPVSLCYVAARGLPLGGEAIETITMRRRDASVAAVIWRLLRLLPLDVVVELHPPILIDERVSRRQAGEHCRRLCAEGVRRNRRAWAFYAIGDSDALNENLPLKARAV